MNIDAAFITAAIVIVSGAVTTLALIRPAGWVAAVVLGAAVLIPGLLAGDPVLALAVAAAASLVSFWHWRGRVRVDAFKGLLPQSILLTIGYLLYVGGRVLVRSDARPAISNAREVISLERTFGLWIEHGVQDALGHGLIAEMLNNVYLFAFYPVPLVALIIFYVRDRDGYRILRDSLGISVILALITIAVFPVAPPRFVPGLGIFDTISAAGGDRPLANQFAAVPSLHVGWPTLVGLMMATRGPRWIKFLSPIPGGLMAITVIATGNHYWFDAAVGAAFAAGPALLFMAYRREDYAPETAPAPERGRASGSG